MKHFLSLIIVLMAACVGCKHPPKEDLLLGPCTIAGHHSESDGDWHYGNQTVKASGFTLLLCQGQAVYLPDGQLPSPPIISQSTSGNCSGIVSDASGNVNITCGDATK